MKTCITCGRDLPLAEYSQARPDKPYLKRSCKTCWATQQHARYMEHRDEWLGWQKQYAAEHRDQVRRAHQRARERRMQDPAYVERLRTENREYHRANKEKRAVRQRRRLERIATNGRNDFTRKQWNALVVAYGGRCAYCGAEDQKLETEHVIPLLHGGHHTVRNIVPTCRPCNTRKRRHTGVGYPFLVIPNRFVT